MSTNTAGRPPRSTPNPNHSIMIALSAANLDPGSCSPIGFPEWFLDIVTGSISTAAGSSGGKFNVSPRAVQAALYLPVISVEAIKAPAMSLRTAQTIAKAARHAAHGVHSYLARNPKLLARLIAESKLEQELWAG